MSLIEDASLIQIPSGYKEDKLYSIKPTNGDGDFTFTRASSATRVNSEGLIEEVPYNLLEQSNTFNTTWTATNSSRTSGQSGYDGSSNAWLLQSTIASGEAYLRQTFSVSGEKTFSIYAKAGTSDFLGFYINATSGLDPFAYFNLSTGAVGTTSATASASIVSVGSGWYRCSVNYDAIISNIDVYVTSSNGSFLSTTGDNIYIQDAQLNSGSTAKPYFPTTDRLNVPRLDYSGGASCASLLLEPQRTNVLFYSEDFSNADWSKLNITINSNTSTSPDGTNNASLIYPTTSGTDRLIEKVKSATIGQVWTSSFFVKASGFSWVLTYAPNLGVCWFNASTGVFGNVANGVIAKVLGQVNGFWRISLTGTLGTNNAYFYAGVADSNGTNFATTSGTNGISIYGAQLEQGSYPTSYIISNSGTTTTRIADACNGAGTSATFNDSEGVLMAEISALADDETLRFLSLSDGTINQRIVFGFPDTSNTIRVVSGPSNLLIETNLDIENNNKISLIYESNNVNLWVNGYKVATSNSYTPMTGFNSLNFNSGAGSSIFYGKTKQLQYYDSALTDAKLEELTSWSSFNEMANALNYTII